MKYLFTGNRIETLNEMVRLGLKITILPPQLTRQKYIEEIKKRDFNIFVSNGCPYILPISKIKKPHQLFINLHPSLLPDLKGPSPILEAIKQNKPMGATCHIMIDEVDSGPILSQVKINPNRKDLNECYRESFRAEAKAFKIAHKNNFRP